MASVTVRIAYAEIRHDVDLDRLAPLVRSAGGRLLSATYVVGVGRLACALGIDAALFELVAALAPTDPPCHN